MSQNWQYVLSDSKLLECFIQNHNQWSKCWSPTDRKHELILQQMQFNPTKAKLLQTLSILLFKNIITIYMNTSKHSLPIPIPSTSSHARPTFRTVITIKIAHDTAILHHADRGKSLLEIISVICLEHNWLVILYYRQDLRCQGNIMTTAGNNEWQKDGDDLSFSNWWEVSGFSTFCKCAFF